MDEAESRRIASLLGPTMIVMIVSEFPLVQPRLYDMQIPPVVYLSGVLMFVAGLAIVRAHNRWGADWTVLVTLSGWFALSLGVVRMFAASRYQQRAASIESTTFMAIESVLLVCGLVSKSFTDSTVYQGSKFENSESVIILMILMCAGCLYDSKRLPARRNPTVTRRPHCDRASCISSVTPNADRCAASTRLRRL